MDPVIMLSIHLLVAFLVLIFRVTLMDQPFFKMNRWILLLIVPIAVVIFYLPKPVGHLGNENLTTDTVSISEGIQLVALSEEGTGQINQQSTRKEGAIHWITLFWSLYVLGMVVASIRFLAQVVQLFRLLRSSTQEQISSFQYYSRSQTEVAPFSFFSYIFLPKDQFEDALKYQILQHESVHVKQWHSLDVLWIECLKVLFWANPFIYWYAKMVKNNLEYLVDDQLMREGVDRMGYQFSLLKISLGTSTYQLSNHYNQSFIKKRIQMMNLSPTKNGAFMPRLLVFAIALIPAIQLFGQNSYQTANNQKSIYFLFDENLSQEEFSQFKTTIEGRANYDLEVMQSTFKADEKVGTLDLKLISTEGEGVISSTCSMQFNGTHDDPIMEKLGFPVYKILYIKKEGEIGCGNIIGNDIVEILKNYDQIDLITGGFEASKSKLIAIKEQMTKNKRTYQKYLKENASTLGEERYAYSGGSMTFDFSRPGAVKEASQKIMKLKLENENVHFKYLKEGKQTSEFKAEDVFQSGTKKLQISEKYRFDKVKKEQELLLIIINALDD